MPRPARHDPDSLLDGAVRLFWEHGYQGTSMKRLEENLDIRPGSLYAAFGSKAGLFAEVLERFAAHSRAELEAHLRRAGSCIEGLQSYLRALGRPPGKKAPAQACLIVKTLLETEAESPPGIRARALLDAVEKHLCRQLEAARERGELASEVDSARLARLVQAQVIGLRTLAHKGGSPQQLQALADDLATSLERYRA